MQMTRYKEPKIKIGWAEALKKDLNTIIDSGTLNSKEQASPNDVVVSKTEANMIKLYQDVNVDKLKVRICVRGDLQKKDEPTTEDPHSLAAYRIISRLLMVDAYRHKARIFKLVVIGAYEKQCFYHPTSSLWWSVPITSSGSESRVWNNIVSQILL
jgi:hypothetical protein